MEAHGCVWDLPVNVLVRILSFLPARSIAFCNCVAKSWMWAAQDSECVERVGEAGPVEAKVIYPQKKMTCRLCSVCQSAELDWVLPFDFRTTVRVLFFDSGKLNSAKVWLICF